MALVLGAYAVDTGSLEEWLMLCRYSPFMALVYNLAVISCASSASFVRLSACLALSRCRVSLSVVGLCPSSRVLPCFTPWESQPRIRCLYPASCRFLLRVWCGARVAVLSCGGWLFALSRVVCAVVAVLGVPFIPAYGYRLFTMGADSIAVSCGVAWRLNHYAVWGWVVLCGSGCASAVRLSGSLCGLRLVGYVACTSNLQSLKQSRYSQ